MALLMSMNAGRGSGVTQVGGRMEEFRVSWSQTYHCFRGGKLRLKPEVKNPLKRRNAPGSRRRGCPAEIRARLMVTKVASPCYRSPGGVGQALRCT